MPSATAPVDELSGLAAPELNFKRVVIDCAANVSISQSEACTVQLTGAGTGVARLQVEQMDGVLRVSGPLDVGAEVTITVSGPMIQSVVHRGSGQMDVDIECVRRLELVNHGNGLMIGRGSVAVLHAFLRGEGSMQLQGLAAAHAWLANYGKGNLHAVVNGSVRLDPVGPGSIKINEHLKKPGRR